MYIITDEERAKVDEVLSELGFTVGGLESVEYLSGGYSNRNYKLTSRKETMVLRVSRTVAPRPSSERAYLALEVAPEVLAYDSSTGHMLTRWVEGALLVQKPFSARKAAEYLNDLHRTIPTGLAVHEPMQRSKEQFQRSGVTNHLLEHLLTSAWRPRQLCGCHNDLNPYNIVCRRDGFVTLDWEFAGDNDPVFDAVNLCYGLQFSDTEFRDCVTGIENVDVDEAFLLETRLLFQIREHSWALDQIANGNDRPEIRQQARNTEIEFDRLMQI